MLAFANEAKIFDFIRERFSFGSHIFESETYCLVVLAAVIDKELDDVHLLLELVGKVGEIFLFVHLVLVVVCIFVVSWDYGGDHGA